MTELGPELLEPTGSTDPALAFDTWRTPSATSLTIVSIMVNVDPSGTNPGIVNLEIDESGGTTADYSFDRQLPAGLTGDRFLVVSVLVPPGGAYQIENVSDPLANNAIVTHREWVF